jgi:hypothetical protein
MNSLQHDEVMLPSERLRAAFVLYPGLLKTTEKLLLECEIDFDFSTKKTEKPLPAVLKMIATCSTNWLSTA